MGDGESIAEQLEKALPYYLNSADKKKLAEMVRGYLERNANPDFYSLKSYGPDEPVQGDGWNGFSKLNFESQEPQLLAGIVISNSCDIDETNPSLRDRNVLFAPIQRLSDYETDLSEAGVSADRIESHLQSIREQTKTDVFYLPPSPDTPEAIVLLDDVCPEPLAHFSGQEQRRILFRLNPFGFYMFLMKLSIHFTRIGEELERSWADGATGS